GLLTEDKNNDDFLNPGEDVGYVTHDFRFGENNGQLDSEDLDGNGRLDQSEGYLHFPAVNASDTVTSDSTSHGWTLLKIPLNTQYGNVRGNANSSGLNPVDTPTRSEVLRNASTVRLTYQAPDNSGKDRSFLLEQMGAVQTRWQAPKETESFGLEVKTSAEDPRLPAPNTEELRPGDDERIVKGLSYRFKEISKSDSKITRASIDFPNGQNVRNFKKMQLYFNTRNYPGASPSGDGDSLTVRFGTDKRNYFQQRFPLLDPDQHPDVQRVKPGEEWYKLTIDLSQFEEDLIQKTLSENSGSFKKGTRKIVGSPSLLKVKKYTLGLIGPDPPTQSSGELLFEGFHLSDPRLESGTAKQISANADIRDGLINLRGQEREVDGEFRTIGLVNNPIANQFVAQNEQSRSLNGSVNLNRYIPNSWSISVPLGFNWSEQTTEIPPDRIERVRNDNLGTVVNKTRSLNSGLNTPSFVPNFSFSWTDNSKNVVQRQREKRWSEKTERWKVNSSYGLKFRDSIGGYVPIGDRFEVNLSGNYNHLNDRKRSFGEVPVDTEARTDVSRQFSTTLNSRPIGWLDSSLSYSFSDQNRNSQQTSGLIQRNQSINFSLDFSSFLGIQPRFTLGTGINENYDRGANPSKNVGLNGNSSMRINTNPERWWNALDFLSLNYSYNVGSSARYTGLDTSRSNSVIYGNFYRGLGWILTGPDIRVTSDTLTLSRNRASKNVGHRLGGQLRFWNWLDTQYNLNLSQNFGQSDNSVNRTNALSLSLNNRFRLQDISSYFRNNTQNASLNVNYSFSSSEASSGKSRTHSPNLQLNTRWNRWWSTNFNLSTTFSREKDQAVMTKNRRYSPSLNFNWLLNEAKGEGGTLWFDNRLELNGTVSGQVQEKRRNEELRQDNWQLSFNAGGSYNITERIKTRFGGNYSIYRDRVRVADDRNSFGVNTSLDFRF
ncbi:MAG: hypothetical protein ABEK50_02710, partial [bacterium]